MATLIRTLGLSASARVVTLPVTALATIITTYLLVRELGIEVFAYVVLVGALFQLISFADLGMGAAVVNASAKRLDSKEEAARALATAATAFRLLSMSAVLIVAIVFSVGGLGAWPMFLGLPEGYADSSRWAIALVILPFAISLPFGIGQRILVGEGRNHVVGFMGVLGPVTATAITFVLLHLNVEPLLLAIATPAGILLVSIACFMLALRTSGWNAHDVVIGPRNGLKPKVWSSAAPMLVISITVPLALQSDRLVLSHFSTSFELSEYSIAAQMYVPCFSIVSMAAVALWPIFSRLGAASQPMWSKAFMILAGGGTLLASCFVLLVGPVSKAITEDKLTVQMDLALALGALLIVMACHQASAVLLTSPTHLLFQAKCSTAMLVVNLSLSILMSPFFGASGVVWASAIAVAVTQLVPCIFKAREFMRASSVKLEAWV